MICLIAAVSKNNVIGKNGKLPWHLPADLAHFREITTGQVVVMGRKTYESIGKPLPNRTNIILSRGLDKHSIGDVFYLNNKNKDQKIFIIGGEQIYRAFLPYADKLYLTHVDAIIEDGDTLFPEINWLEWNLVNCVSHNANALNPYDFDVCEYERVRSNEC